MSLNKRGWLNIYHNQDDKPQTIVLNLDKRESLATGNYMLIEEDLDTKNLEGIMEAYRKIDNGDFRFFNKKGEYGTNPHSKLKLKKDCLQFMDRYIFDTPEKKEKLKAYIAKKEHLKVIENDDFKLAFNYVVTDGDTRTVNYDVQDKRNSNHYKFSIRMHNIFGNEIKLEKNGILRRSDHIDGYISCMFITDPVKDLYGRFKYKDNSLSKLVRKPYLAFMDKYVFNTEESRAELNRYLINNRGIDPEAEEKAEKGIKRRLKEVLSRITKKKENKSTPRKENKTNGEARQSAMGPR